MQGFLSKRTFEKEDIAERKRNKLYRYPFSGTREYFIRNYKITMQTLTFLFLTAATLLLNQNLGTLLLSIPKPFFPSFYVLDKE